MADVREQRIYCAEQIVVPEELPNILKHYSKAVIKENPANIVSFSAKYFRNLLDQQNNKAKDHIEKPDSHHWLSPHFIILVTLRLFIRGEICLWFFWEMGQLFMIKIWWCFVGDGGWDERVWYKNKGGIGIWINKKILKVLITHK